MKIILKGVEWQCHSPSHFILAAPNTDVDLWWSGVAWRIFLAGDIVPYPYATRDEAAQDVANGIYDGTLLLMFKLIEGQRA